jgi:hypothetical protein
MPIPQLPVVPPFSGLALTRLTLATWATQVETARRLGAATWQPFVRRPLSDDAANAG